MHIFSNLFKCFLFSLFLLFFFFACKNNQPATPLPDIYKIQGSYIQTLPYFNPDSCVLLIQQDVPPHWQGAVYENLFLNGPEDSPLELGFQHLDYYDKYFPADSARAFTQSWRGRLLTYVGEFDSAQVCLQESFEISNRIGDFLQANETKSNMGNIYLRKGNYPLAIRSFLEAHETVNKLDSTHNALKSIVTFNVANTYYSSNNQKEALAWAKRGMHWAEEANDPVMQVENYQMLSTIYRAMNLPDSSLIMAEKAFEIHEKYQTTNSRFDLFKFLSIAYWAKEECQTALEYLTKALQSIQVDAKNQSSVDINFMNIYICLGELDSAKIYNDRLFESPNVKNKKHAQEYLGEIYAGQGKYQLAYGAMVKSKEMDKEFYNVEEMQQTGAAKAELELQLERSIAKEQSQKHKIEQQRTLTGLLLALVGLGFASVLIYGQRTKRKFLEQEKELVESREIIHLQELADRATKLKNTQINLANTKEALKESNELLAIKTQFIEGLQMQMSEIEDAASKSNGNGDYPTKTLRGLRILTKEDWVQFRRKFDEVFPAFLEKLNQAHPELTPAETRLFLLLKSGFDTSEIADALGISQQSVWRSRIRLAKKLGLESTTLLDGFVLEF